MSAARTWLGWPSGAGIGDMTSSVTGSGDTSLAWESVRWSRCGRRCGSAAPCGVTATATRVGVPDWWARVFNCRQFVTVPKLVRDRTPDSSRCRCPTPARRSQLPIRNRSGRHSRLTKDRGYDPTLRDLIAGSLLSTMMAHPNQGCSRALAFGRGQSPGDVLGENARPERARAEVLEPTTDRL